MKRIATKNIFGPVTADERRDVAVHDVDEFFERFLRGLPPRGMECEWGVIVTEMGVKYTQQVATEDSVVICYMAFRKCVVKWKHRNPNYVRRACDRAHIYELRRRMKRKRVPLTVDVPMEMPWGELDLAMDIDSLLGGGDRAALVRGRIIEGRPFADVKARRAFWRAVDLLGPLLREAT